MEVDAVGSPAVSTNARPHSEWRVVPGWKLETVAYDWMHNVFVGTARDLVASTIRTLIRHKCYEHVSDNVETVLDHIHREILSDTKAQGLLGSIQLQPG